MHIAICDDNCKELLHISGLLDSYRQEKDADFTFKVYSNATELIFDMENKFYDLLLLDILMPGLSGIKAAKEIRESNSVVKIIFLTSSPEFALESYGVRAEDYILKPISKERFFSTLDNLFAQDKTASEGFSIKTQSAMTKILFSNIVYVEVMNKRLYFYLSDGSIHEIYSSLSNYEDTLLSREGFIKVHRSYIVNMWKMSKITKNKFITQKGTIIPISRLLYSEVRKAYMEYLFKGEKI